VAYGGTASTFSAVDTFLGNNPPVDIAAHFGKNLSRCRKRADLSQEELSVRASLHRTEISQLERGLRIARIDTLVKLAGSLEVSADELLVGMGWSPGGTRIGNFKADPQDSTSDA
jgi:transcriptional regulator with XRE-family HTH domain